MSRSQTLEWSSEQLYSPGRLPLPWLSRSWSRDPQQFLIDGRRPVSRLEVSRRPPRPLIAAGGLVEDADSNDVGPGDRAWQTKAFHPAGVRAGSSHLLLMIGQLRGADFTCSASEALGSMSIMKLILSESTCGVPSSLAAKSQTRLNYIPWSAHLCHPVGD